MKIKWKMVVSVFGFLLLASSVLAQSPDKNDAHCVHHFNVIFVDQLGNRSVGMSDNEFKWYKKKKIAQKYSYVCYDPQVTFEHWDVPSGQAEIFFITIFDHMLLGIELHVEADKWTRLHLFAQDLTSHHPDFTLIEDAIVFLNDGKLHH